MKGIKISRHNVGCHDKKNIEQIIDQTAENGDEDPSYCEDCKEKECEPPMEDWADE